MTWKKILGKKIILKNFKNLAKSKISLDTCTFFSHHLSRVMDGSLRDTQIKNTFVGLIIGVYISVKYIKPNVLGEKCLMLYSLVLVYTAHFSEPTGSAGGMIWHAVWALLKCESIWLGPGKQPC